MEVKNAYLFLLVFIFLPTVSAGAYRIGNDVAISHSVRLDGAPIATNPSCNLTVFYNGTLLVPYTPMTYNSSAKTVNYTLDKSYLNATGAYRYDVTCCTGSQCTTAPNDFTVSKSGVEISTATSLFYVILLILSVGVFVFFLFSYKNIESSDSYNTYDELVAINWKKYSKYGYLLLAFLSFVWVMFNGWVISVNFLDGVEGISGILYLGWSLPIRFGGIVLGAVVFLFMWSAWNDFIKSKEIERFGSAS